MEGSGGEGENECPLTAYLNAPPNEEIHIYETSEGHIEAWTGRKSVEVVERPVWIEADRPRVVYGDVEGLHDRDGV